MSGAMQPSLPSRCYTDEQWFERERSGIFDREWSIVCRTEELPGPGNWRVFDLAGNDILLVRDKANSLHAFYNVCRHRGARLCVPPDAPRRPGRALLPNAVRPNGALRCPYHGWTYDAQGNLIGVPHIAAGEAIAREEFSLYPVGCAQWGGFVLLNPTPQTAPPLAPQTGEADRLFANYDLQSLRIGHRIAYTVDANWKILCENYNECYHCGPIHPELTALVPAFGARGGADLDWERGIAHRPGAYTFTQTGTTKRAPLPGLNEDERTRHKGALLYPNLFLSLSADHVCAFILWPRGPARTDIDCLFLFASDDIEAPDFDHTDATGFWDIVNQQDWAICERVQTGMYARPHVQGYYAPMEDWNLDIRRYVTDRMGQDPAGPT
jgi:Rieske 2Fe-2S family protein